MVEKLNHYPVNWIDGMKINKSHFQSIQDYVSDISRDAAGIYCNAINYGLVPSKDSLRLEVVIDNQKMLRVRVEECQAITPNGSRISIHSQKDDTVNLLQSYQEETLELEFGEYNALMICISVNQFKREPFGEADPNETPPRLPYTKPDYKLYIIPENEWESVIGKSGHYLTLGRVLVNANETILDKSYLPPSVTVASHPDLEKLHAEIDRFFGQIELYSVQILQKIHSKNQNNTLATLVKIMTNNTIYYLGQEINKFRVLGYSSPPAGMLMSVVGLSRVIKNYIDSYSGAGKEELLNYFTQWCDLSQGDFETIFSETNNTDYNHNEMDKSIAKVKRFMETYENLLSVLNKLDYIGKLKDGSIFVSEQETGKDNVVQPKRSRTFLAD